MSALRPAARISTSACSDEPIAPCSRSASSRFCTSARTARSALQRSTSAGLVRNLRQLRVGLGEDRAAVVPPEDLPRLLGGERQQRRHQAQQARR